MGRIEVLEKQERERKELLAGLVPLLEALTRPDHGFPKREVTTRLEEWQEGDLLERRAAAQRDLDEIVRYLEGFDPTD